MKPELHFTADDEIRIMETLIDHGWVRQADHWRHPHTKLVFTLATAAKLDGCYPSDEVDSLHPFLKQIKRHIDEPGQPDD